jgi:MFS transporter, OPA family, glycerol-3-phosphate transporter
MLTSPRIRRLGFWAAVGALFVALSLLVQPGASAADGSAEPGSGSGMGIATPTGADAGTGIGAAPAVVGDPCLAPAPPKAKRPPDKPLWEKMIPIAVLLLVIAIVVARLPRADLGHSPEFRRRRLLNWLPLGLTYSFLYMARYNINQYMTVGAITEAQFGTIGLVGSIVYGVSFLLNGPLTDRWGGRTTILIAAGGSAISNALMGLVVVTGEDFGNPVATLAVLYGLNMYFQSFGAVSIVKVNAAWFHLRERGTFGGIFGILISLGLFFAFDGGKMITDNLQIEWLFFLPAMLLVVFFLLSARWVRDTPSHAGHPDFDLGVPDGDGVKRSAVQVIKKMLTHPVILTIATIELCSGFLRQAILQWGREFGKGAGLSSSFVFENWGVVSCIAGITGGIFAGSISDHLFHSRRLPVSAVLYAIMLVGGILILPLFGSGLAAIPWIIAFMSMAIIGVHGMLSGTASADFGGKANTGVAVGIIDGFVYAGTAVQFFIYGRTLPAAKLFCADGTTRVNPESKIIDNWKIWPYAMIPVALIGFVLAVKLWNARADQTKKKSG